MYKEIKLNWKKKSPKSISMEKIKEFLNSKEEWEIPTLTVKDIQQLKESIRIFGYIALFIGFLIGLLF